MKKILVTILIATALRQVNAQRLASAQSIIDDACKLAAQQHKNAFIIFHASWCGWCRKMDSSMNSSSLKSFFDSNYVIQHITVLEDDSTLDNPGASNFLVAHNAADQGIPAWFIFNGSGKLLANSQKKDLGSKEGINVGCPSAQQEVDYFITVLKKTSDINNEKITAVQRVFSDNQSNLLGFINYIQSVVRRMI